MKVMPFWGCMIPLKYPQMEKAVRISMKNLDVELTEEPGFTCCPDPIYFKAGDKLTWYTIAARNISLAEDAETDIVTMCSGCTSTLCEVNEHLKKDKSLRDRVNKNLKKIGREFKGTIEVKHLVTMLRDEIGYQQIVTSVSNPLEDVKVAIHYGCHLLKPSGIMQVEDPVFPSILSDLLKLTGATPVNHKEYLLCCGKACHEPEISSEMSYSVFKSIQESGSDCLGLICPTCFDSFDLGQLKISRQYNEKFQIPVIYYFQLLAIAQGSRPEDVGLKYHRIMTDSFMQKLSRESITI